MDTNKMRKQFEAWWSRTMNTQEMDLHRHIYPMNGGWSYACHETNRAWMSWQASREAVVVDLSDLSRCFSPNDCGDWAMWLDDVKKLIEAQGLKVAP